MTLVKGKLAPGHFRRSTLHTQALHVERTSRRRSPAPETPELAAAWHSLQLHWLATTPGYREEVRRRVSEAARRAEARSRKFDRQYEDRDYLGREVEGCG